MKKVTEEFGERSCYSWWLEKRRSGTGMWCSVKASNKDLKKERIKKRNEGRKKEKIQ